jgi:hypothetical protein
LANRRLRREQDRQGTGQGIVLDIVLGIVGALVGGFIFDAAGGVGVTGFNAWTRRLLGSPGRPSRRRYRCRSDRRQDGPLKTAAMILSPAKEFVPRRCKIFFQNFGNFLLGI